MKRFFSDFPGFPAVREKFTEVNDPQQARDDHERERAAQEIADAMALDNYTPPLPVAVVTVEKRPDWARGLRSSVWIVRPPAAFPGMAQDAARLTSAEEGLDFPINTIMVDNWTSGFMYWHEVGVWVAPFNFGKVFRFDGSHKAYVRYETPPGLTAVPAVNQAQRARVTFFNELLPENAGQILLAGQQ